MPNENGRLPIALGKRVCEEHRLTQIIVIGKTQTGTQVCMTYGITMEDCRLAAIAGKFWNRVIGLGTKKDAVEAIKELLRELESENR